MANSLIHESSPYLLQHANNPVDWHAWNEDTLKKAADENKMLLISIGYAACHWCHVMEKESFENEAVAAVMNKHFICIKVDREERPDVDQVYMDAAYLINGNGGWPLNALAMPDGRPFFAGTYYPPDNWTRLLEYFAEIYASERKKLDDQADNVSAGIRNMEKIPLNEDPVYFTNKELTETALNLQKRVDREFGGTLGKMKFPMPSVWEFLLQFNQATGNAEALSLIKITLDKMAAGGIYDQVGGGFSRYATDPEWHVPHFEKMLYDNGQLVSLYSRAYQVTGNEKYKRVVYETIAFISRELTSGEGGFYSSLDADSEGEEGKFYVWSDTEIDKVLKEEAAFYKDYYGIKSNGNWEFQKNIPDINMGSSAGENSSLQPNELYDKLDRMSKKLLAEREKRIRPATDDKILTSWNALMAMGLIEAYKAFGEESFFKTAKKNIDFLIANVCNEDDSVYRNYKNGRAGIHAFLDDYAFLISALIAFYQVSFEEKYLFKAKKLAEYVQVHFYDKLSGMYFYTDDRYSKLIARKMETTDNVIPSSNSEMVKNLMRLAAYFDRTDYEMQAIQMLKNVQNDMVKNATYYSNWAQAMIAEIYKPIELAIVGGNWRNILAGFNKQYLPHTLFMGGEKGSLPLLEDKKVADKTLIYVCRNKACGLPVENIEEALAQMQIQV